MVERLRPDLLVVGLTNMRGHFPVEDILECRFRGVRVEEWTTFYEKLTGTIFVSTLRPSWLIFSAGTVITRLTETVKRVLDITFALAGLLLSAPLMICAMACIKLDTNRTPLVPTRTGREASEGVHPVQISFDARGCRTCHGSRVGMRAGPTGHPGRVDSPEDPPR